MDLIKVIHIKKFMQNLTIGNTDGQGGTHLLPSLQLVEIHSITFRFWKNKK